MNIALIVLAVLNLGFWGVASSYAINEKEHLLTPIALTFFFIQLILFYFAFKF